MEKPEKTGPGGDTMKDTIPASGDSLRFDSTKYTEKNITVDGTNINYRAYEGIVYVANPVEAAVSEPGPGTPHRNEPFNKADYKSTAYQSMNIYIPESAYKDSSVPIFLRNNIGAYMPSLPQPPRAADASGRALKEGYVLAVPGTRGSATTTPDGKVYLGKAPAAIVDLKAAVRYLRYNNRNMPGDAEKIISSGISAGGAFSALLGASGNSERYEPYLQAIGAAGEKDDIYMAVCYCPIMDLEHADTAYEWLFNRVNNEEKYQFTETQKALSLELKSLYPGYLSGLDLKTNDGVPLTAANYDAYIRRFLIRSAQTALDAKTISGEELAKNTWITLDGTTVTGIDYEAYLSYVGRLVPLKNPPAFDNLGVNNGEEKNHLRGSRENMVFGTSLVDALNFTDWSLRIASSDGSASIAQDVKDRVYLMNPMNFIGETGSTTARNWYIRHGARDRDTAFMVAINLYSKLIKKGYAANFGLAWDRPHGGDYDLDELFAWIASVAPSTL
jgi:hypothetical protein